MRKVACEAIHLGNRKTDGEKGVLHLGQFFKEATSEIRLERCEKTSSIVPGKLVPQRRDSKSQATSHKRESLQTVVKRREQTFQLYIHLKLIG